MSSYACLPNISNFTAMWTDTRAMHVHKRLEMRKTPPGENNIVESLYFENGMIKLKAQLDSTVGLIMQRLYHVYV